MPDEHVTTASVILGSSMRAAAALTSALLIAAVVPAGAGFAATLRTGVVKPSGRTSAKQGEADMWMITPQRILAARRRSVSGVARSPRLTTLIRRRLRALVPRKGERRARTEFWDLATSMTPYVAAEHDDAVFVVPTVPEAGKLFISNARRSEFVGLARASAVLRDAGRLTEPATIVDVGAHLGTTTITALVSQGFAHAVAVEPDPDNLRLLRANIALNGLVERATVVPVAVSGNPGTRWFKPRRERGRWASGVLTDQPVPGTLPVDALTLDGLVEGGFVDPATVGLLWLGRALDEATLMSGMPFFSERIPIVFVFPRRRITASSPFLRQLEESGYEHSIDLRRPNLDQELSEWTPEIKPVRAIATLLPRKSITDVLVF